MIALILLTKLHPPDGADRAAFAQFLGRFHPLFVHLPIGFLILVPILELAGATERHRYLRTTAGFVLVLGFIFALFAAYDGWLLAWSGGYKGPLVIRHMWGAVLVALASITAVTLRPKTSPAPAGAAGTVGISSATRAGAIAGENRLGTRAAQQPRVAYGVALVVTLGLLFWASHSGGGLSHGDTFLTEEMPPRLKTLLKISSQGGAAPAAAEPRGSKKTVYAAKIQPIFDRSCVPCHGPQKVKGGLRMDSYALLMKGGKTGSEVTPWDPDNSDIYHRITLAPDDDDFMPNNGKNLLSDAEKSLIKNWILAGASDQQPLP